MVQGGLCMCNIGWGFLKKKKADGKEFNCQERTCQERGEMVRKINKAKKEAN